MILNKKGQGALEYLMTYGWALVVIAVVIGVLIFMGILKAPSAGTCTGLEKLAYEDHTIDSNGNFILYLKNGTGMQITNVQAIPGEDFSGACSATPATVNATKDFNIVCSNTGVSAGQTYAGKIKIEYKRRLAEHTETATCTGTAPLSGIILVGGAVPQNTSYWLISSADIATAYNSQRKLVRDSDDSRIYWVYEAATEVWFVQSDNNGSTWSTPVNISSNSGFSRFPSIDINSTDGLHVVWRDDGGGDLDILYKSCSGDCSNAGNWSNDVNVSNNSWDSYVPSIDINSSDGVHVVWYGNTYGVLEILYKSCSGDCGIAGNWSADVNISNNSGTSYYPSIDINSSDGVHVVWMDDTYLDNETLYKSCSGDCGIAGNWSADVNISNNSGQSVYPGMVISGDNKIHVVWMDNTSMTNYGVRYKNCSSNCNAAASWGNDFNVSDENGNFPTIAFDSYNNTYVLWMDDNAWNDRDNINTRKRQVNGTWDANIIKTTDGNDNQFPNAAKTLLAGAPYSYLQYVYTRGLAADFNIVFVSEAT